MGRTLSSNINTAIAAVDTETHDLMVITVPVLGGSPIVFYLGTGEVTIGAQVYQRSIRSLPSITFSRGDSSADGGTFTLENLSSTFGPAFLNQSRPLDGASVVVLRAFRVSAQSLPAIWETDEIARGLMRVQQVTEEIITASFISDLSDSSALIGGEPLTQRCIKVFNKGGLTPTIITAPCGWLLAQGGDPNSCDHVLDSSGGCLGHANQFRFGGVPPLAATAVVVSGSGPGVRDPPGHDDGYDHGRFGECFVCGTMILVPGGQKPIELFEQGDPILVWDFTQRRLVESIVTRTEQHENKLTRRVLLQSGHESRPSFEQLLWNGREWVRHDTMQHDHRFVSINSDFELVDDIVLAVEDPKILDVHHLHVAHHDHNYIAERMIAHNVKPILGLLP